MGFGGRQDVWVRGESTKLGLAGGRMCEWEGFGGRQDMWVAGGSTEWDLAGGRMLRWEEGAQNGIWQEAGCVGGRTDQKMGFDGR